VVDLLEVQLRVTVFVKPRDGEISGLVTVVPVLTPVNMVQYVSLRAGAVLSLPAAAGLHFFFVSRFLFLLSFLKAYSLSRRCILGLR